MVASGNWKNGLRPQGASRFSDIAFVAACKKRGFCRLRRMSQRKTDSLSRVQKIQ
jgi:hypothetical protein